MGREVDADPLYMSPQISVQQNCLKPVFGDVRRKGLSPSSAFQAGSAPGQDPLGCLYSSSKGAGALLLLAGAAP